MPPHESVGSLRYLIKAFRFIDDSSDLQGHVLDAILSEV